MPAVESFNSPRSWAFAILGIDEYLKTDPYHDSANEIARKLTRRIVELWHANSDESWPWFEGSLTYGNARLCQAMILSGQRYSDSEALEIGLKSLRWLTSIQTTQNGNFRPIGSNGFYQRNGNRADFDQQPVEAQAMIAACNVAHRVTENQGAESTLAFHLSLAEMNDTERLANASFASITSNLPR